MGDEAEYLNGLDVYEELEWERELFEEDPDGYLYDDDYDDDDDD